MKTLLLEDFAQLFSTTVAAMPQECSQLIQQLDFHYEPQDQLKREAIILKILKKLEADWDVSGKHRLQRWEEGWSENLAAFVASGYDTKALIPAYFRSSTHQFQDKPAIRWKGNYILPIDPEFMLNVLTVLRVWLAQAFLQTIDHVYELGCGPAYNLVALAERDRTKRYYGLDWAAVSQQIIAAIAHSHPYQITGHPFDMFAPDPAFSLQPNAAVLTVCALEQLGANFKPLLTYLLQQAPTVCIHLEPIVELYDQDNLFDYVAAKYCDRRGYLKGYLPYLQQLQAAGQIEILYVQKNLGSLYYDCWTTIVWKPIYSDFRSSEAHRVEAGCGV